MQSPRIPRKPLHNQSFIRESRSLYLLCIYFVTKHCMLTKPLYESRSNIGDFMIRPQDLVVGRNRTEVRREGKERTRIFAFWPSIPLLYTLNFLNSTIDLKSYTSLRTCPKTLPESLRRLVVSISDSTLFLSSHQPAATDGRLSSHLAPTNLFWASLCRIFFTCRPSLTDSNTSAHCLSYLHHKPLTEILRLA